MPQLFDEPLRSERTAGLNREQRQQGALSRSTERDPCIAARRLDGSEQAQLEALRASFRSHRSILGGMRCTGNRSSKRTLEIARAPCHHGRREGGHRRTRRGARRPARPRRAGRGRCRRPRARRRGGHRQVDALAGRRRRGARAGAPRALRAARRVRAGTRVRRARRPARGRRRRGAAGALGAAAASARGGAAARRRGRPRGRSPRARGRRCTTRSSRWLHAARSCSRSTTSSGSIPASAECALVRAAAARPRADQDPPRSPGRGSRRRSSLPFPDRSSGCPVGPLSLGAIQGLVRDRLGLRFPRPTMLRLHEVVGRQSLLRARARRERSMRVRRRSIPRSRCRYPTRSSTSSATGCARYRRRRERRCSSWP